MLINEASPNIRAPKDPSVRVEIDSEHSQEAFHEPSRSVRTPKGLSTTFQPASNSPGSQSRTASKRPNPEGPFSKPLERADFRGCLPQTVREQPRPEGPESTLQERFRTSREPFSEAPNRIQTPKNPSADRHSTSKPSRNPSTDARPADTIRRPCRCFKRPPSSTEPFTRPKPSAKFRRTRPKAASPAPSPREPSARLPQRLMTPKDHKTKLPQGFRLSRALQQASKIHGANPKKHGVNLKPTSELTGRNIIEFRPTFATPKSRSERLLLASAVSYSKKTSRLRRTVKPSRRHIRTPEAPALIS